MKTSMTGLALTGAYALCILYTAVSVRGKNTSDSFFVNNRSGSAWSVALSIIVSCVGASATLGVIGKAFAIGLPAFWWLGAGAAGLTLLSLALAKKVRDSGAYTMPEMVKRYLGPKARPLISLLIVIAWSAILAAQFTALKNVLLSLTGLEGGLCLAIAFGLIVLHTSGGQAVIMRLDRFQSALIIGGLTIALCWLWTKNPGWISWVCPELVNENFSLSDLWYYIFVVGGNYLICPMLFGRLLSAGDAESARRGGIYAVIGLVLCSLLIVAVGLACVGLIPADTPQDAVFTGILDTLLPSWMRLFLLIALTSAIVSSADTCLVTAATVLSYDLLHRRDSAACRKAVLGLGLVGLALSLAEKGILGFLLMAYDVYVCGVVVPVFIALMLGKERYIREEFACIAIVAGGVLGGAAAVSGLYAFSYAGMTLSAIVTFAGVRKRTGEPLAVDSP